MKWISVFRFERVCGSVGVVWKAFWRDTLSKDLSLMLGQEFLLF